METTTKQKKKDTLTRWLCAQASCSAPRSPSNTTRDRESPDIRRAAAGALPRNYGIICWRGRDGEREMD
uniref:Uncharacterized protein n=1 Tax=Caenorhabditis japonica TaxID=281687 RepID=A0A8R1EP50_CAEJA